MGGTPLSVTNSVTRVFESFLYMHIQYLLLLVADVVGDVLNKKQYCSPEYSFFYFGRLKIGMQMCEHVLYIYK